MACRSTRVYATRSACFLWGDQELFPVAGQNERGGFLPTVVMTGKVRPRSWSFCSQDPLCDVMGGFEVAMTHAIRAMEEEY
jgi:hypothetical protein